MTIQPWITCLQSGILIRYLEARYPEQASKVDLKRVMGVAEIISGNSGCPCIPDRYKQLDSPFGLS